MGDLDQERDIEGEIERGLAARLLVLQPTAQLAHLVAIAALVFLLWGAVSARALIPWMVTVAFAVAFRSALTWRAAHREISFDRVRRRIRLAVGSVGLAWGVGAALLLPRMPVEDLTLTAGVLATLVAGGSGTLLADTGAFRLYSICMLAPAVAGVVIAGQDRFHLIVASLILVGFAGFMFRIQSEAHRSLIEKLRTAALLRSALANVKTLKGLLPICASCKKIRDDQGYWGQIESYVREHSEADFSHGLCPECTRRLYPELGNLEEGATN